jgi:hypothetical protein
LSYIFLIFKKKTKKNYINIISPEAILTSVTLAFIWIGNTQYFIPHTDSNGIFSDIRFPIWSIGGYGFLKIYEWMRRSEKYRDKKKLYYVSIYLILFFIISSFQYYKPGEALPKPDRLLFLLSMILVYPFLSVWFYSKIGIVFHMSSEKLK